MRSLSPYLALAFAGLSAALAACAFEPLPSLPAGAPDGPVYLSELQTANDSVTDFQGDTPDWFELYNASGAAVDLSAYSVSDDSGEPYKWRFPAYSLAAGGRLVVFASGKDQTDPAYELHTNFGLSPGETLFLCRDGKAADLVAIPKDAVASGSAWSRSADGALSLTNRPTPGAANAAGLFPPVPSLPAGLYSSADYPAGLAVRLSGEGVIRYTTDGSPPVAGSPVYDPATPIVLAPPNRADPDSRAALPRGLVIKAAAFADGAMSEIVTSSYLIDADGGLAVFSLSAPPASLIDPLSGLLSQAMVGSTMEVPVHVEYFDEAGRRSLDQEAGATQFGAWSRNQPMKSIALRARSAYGAGRFKYDFFGVRNRSGGPIESFDDLVLRNSGNDFLGADQYNFSQGTNLRDAFMTGLTAGSANDYQAYKPVAVFINGRYWGFYSLREKINSAYVADHFPAVAAPDGYDIGSNFGQANAGTNDDFFALLAWLDPVLMGGTGTPPDMNDPAVWSRLAAWVDLDNAADYFIAQLYFANTDWPGNNIKYWRPRVAGGKWRFLLFDTDFGYASGFNEGWSHDTLGFVLDGIQTNWADNPTATLILRRLLENDGFRAAFYARFLDQLSGRYAPAVVLPQLEAMAAQAEREILDHHVVRWQDEARADATPMALRNIWRTQLERMRDFARRRPDYLRAQIAGRLNPLPPVRHDGTGLDAVYYAPPFRYDMDMLPLMASGGGASAARSGEGPLDFNWGRADAPGPSAPALPAGIPLDRFMVRWSGRLRPSFTGPVKLIITADDGVRVYAGGRLVIDAWRIGAAAAYEATVDLVAGVDQNLAIEYFQSVGVGASLRLEWQFGSYRETVPLSQLYPPAAPAP